MLVDLTKHEIGTIKGMLLLLHWTKEIKRDDAENEDNEEKLEEAKKSLREIEILCDKLSIE